MQSAGRATIKKSKNSKFLKLSQKLLEFELMLKLSNKLSKKEYELLYKQFQMILQNT